MKVFLSGIALACVPILSWGQVTPHPIAQESPIQTFDVTANGKVAIEATNGTITWFDLNNKRELKRKNIGWKSVNNLKIRNADTLYATNDTNDIFKLTSQSDNVVRLSGHTKRVTALSIDTLSNHLFSGSMDNSTILWDLKSGSIIKRNSDHHGFVLCTAVNPMNGDMASCGADGYLYIYNNKGALLQSKKVSERWLWGVAFSTNGKMIAVASDDDISVWPQYTDASSTPKVIKGTNAKNTILQFSPDDKYLAAVNSNQKIILINLTNYSISSTHKVARGPVTGVSFHPSGLFLYTSHTNYPGLYEWDIASLNIAPNRILNDKLDKTPPQIYVSNPQNIVDNRAVVYADMIKLEGNIIDEKGVFSLSVNGAKTPVRPNGNFTINIPLSYEDNPIVIEGQDVNGNISVRKFVITRKDANGAQYDPSKAKNYLLIIGINNYKQWPALNNAVDDANAIAGTLSGLYNFNYSDIVMLRDDQATRSNIYNTLRSYVEKVGPQDNFLLYFSGHGYFDPVLSEGFWIPVDANVGSTGEFLSNSDVLKVIKNINSQHTLIIADACFSGSLFNESSRGYIENVERFKSRWALTSGRLEKVSDGVQGSHSPFAKVLLDYLRHTPNEKVSVSELVQYVKTKVPDDAGQTPIGNPLKNAGDEGGEFIFYKRK